MADTAPDRDGLQLDLLRVSLGPILPDWPAGLQMRAQLQGDVVTRAELSWLDAGEDVGSDERVALRPAALDHLGSLLSVAGWPTAARELRQARDGLASSDPRERAAGERRARRVLRRLRRSRTLAWSLRGIGQLTDPDGTTSDVVDRLLRWCDIADGVTETRFRVLSLDEAAPLLQGAEVAAARLVVASLELQRSVAHAEPEAVRA
ncbi:hypothetical protein [Blastococcus litoris]|uniref:hypothetical protein n=1 Tax=Blastococcus litoris TaxID=2171622 RepID=UPI0013DF384F|nr:hypothetical protein [Blastococcus litoris]